MMSFLQITVGMFKLKNTQPYEPKKVRYRLCSCVVYTSFSKSDFYSNVKVPRAITGSKSRTTQQVGLNQEPI